MTLFVNLEPSTLNRHLDVVLDALDGRAEQVQVVVEITERALATAAAHSLVGRLTAAHRRRIPGCC